MNSLQELTARNAELDEQIERVQLSQAIQAKQSAISASTMLEAYPQYLSPQQIRAEIGWGEGAIGDYVSRPDDYRNGDYRPFYENEFDIQQIRGIGRYLAGSDEMTVCILMNLRNYSVGEGAEVSANAKDKADQSLANEVQEFLEEFIDVNDWAGEGESECFLNSVIDGDHLAWLKPRGPHAPLVRCVGGEHIAEPSDIRAVEDYIGQVGLDWKYGVATDQGDPESVAGYFVSWYGDESNWDYVPASDAVFFKRNVPRQCKRGINDFYVPYKLIQKGSKLFDNAVMGATIQASIAGIKKAASGASTAQLADGLANHLTGTATALGPNNQSKTVTYERHIGGKVITASGMDYMHGPMGTPQGPLFLDSVYQAVARRVGSCWCFPEFMISGDASNNNLASALVAEGPLVKYMISEQNRNARQLRKLYWRAVGMAAKNGRFGGLSQAEIYKHVAISVDYQSPESRNPVELEAVRDAQQRAGVLSVKTRAAESGFDYDQELENGAKPTEMQVTPAGSSYTEPTVEQLSLDELAFSLLEEQDG